jgi:cytochrome P450
MNERIFDRPFEFRPQRWLKNEKILEKYLMPFSIGKRFCIGKHLTKDIIFMFLIMVLRSLNFNLTEDVKVLDENEIRTFGLSRSLKPVFDIHVNLN